MLTANFRSFSLIGLQIGSPSRFTITAGVLLKKIGRGIGLDALDVLRHDQALVQIGEDAIERNQSIVVWNRLVDRCGDLPHLLLLKGAESWLRRSSLSES